MIQNHTDAEGDTRMICAMTDEHLANTIRLVCRKIIEVRQSLVEASDATSQYYHLLHGGTKPDVKEAVRTNKQYIKFLYPYLAEAYLRDLKGIEGFGDNNNDDIRNLVVEAIGRDSGLNKAVKVPEVTIKDDGSVILHYLEGA